MGVYYPQGIVSLRMRFEDFGDKENPKFKKEYEVTCYAKSFNVQINDYTKADTFSMTLDFKKFPYDPRLLRACGVTIFLEDREKLFESNNALNVIKPNNDNIIFIGFADSDKIMFNENDRIVTLEGRDYTSLLIDLPYFGGPIATNLPVDQVISNLLKEKEQTRDLVLDKRLPANYELPIAASLEADLSPMAGAKNQRRDDSYWEIIQRLVNDTGLICYVELDKLVLTTPRNLYDRKKAKIFAFGRNITDLGYERKLGRQKGFNVQVVCFNSRLKSQVSAKIPLEASQEWADDMGIKKEEVKVPKAVAFQFAQQPTKAGEDAKKTPVQTAAEAKPDEAAPYLTFKVAESKVTSKEGLVAIGEKIFEEISRQQIEGSFETSEMMVGDAEGGKFSAMKMRVGTPIEVIVDGSDLEGIKKIIKKKQGNTEIDNNTNKKEMKTFLLNRGFKPDIADALSETWGKVDTPFFTKSVEFTLDQDSGFKMKIDFINFITIPQALVQ